MYVVLLASAPVPSTLLIITVNKSKKLQQASEILQAMSAGDQNEALPR